MALKVVTVEPWRAMDAKESILPPWGVPPEKMAAAHEAVRRHFTEAWLTETPAYAPVQKLWQGQDAQSSLELHWLGTALVTFEAIDVGWLAHQVRQARGRDANNRRGAMFEILGLAMFADNHTLIPAPPNTRGYDGHVAFADSKVLLSLKNLGRSQFARDIQKHGRDTLRKVIKSAGEQGANWVGFLVEASCYPKEHDWLELQRVLCANAWRCLKAPGLGRKLPPWTVYPMDAPTGAGPISSAHVSNQLSIIVPHHPNELKTYESKLEEQALQVGRQLQDHDAASAVLLAAVDDTADVAQLSSWSRDFMSRHPNGPIDEIFLYQPSWLIDQNATTKAISNRIA